MTPLRATATLAAGSVVSLAAGAISAKAVALLAGPEGVGTVGLLVSLLSLGAIIGGFGIGTALVRAVAMARAKEDVASIVRLHAAGRIAVVATASIVAVLIIVFREPIAAIALGQASRGGEVALVAIAIIFSSMAGIESSFINGLHRVSVLAAVTAATATATAIALVVAVWVAGASGAAAGLLVGSLAGWIIALAYAVTSAPRSPAIDRGSIGDEARALLRFGGPFTASQLVGTGAQLLIPFIVVSLLQTADVGYYRAAATISVAYLAFLLNAMAQDYYPRISGMRDGPGIADVARTQLRFVLMVSLPLILLTSAIAPLLVTGLYSAEFSPATDVLRWQLIGDVLKLPSWTLSFVILARGTSGAFLTIEAIGGIALVLLSAGAIAAFGLVGAGLGYAGAYAVYYVTVAFAARSRVPIHLGREEATIIGVCAFLIAIELLRPSIGTLLASVLVAVLGLAWAGVSGKRLWSERHG